MIKDSNLFWSIQVVTLVIVFAIAPPQNTYDLLLIPVLAALLYGIIRSKQLGYIH